MTPDSGAVLFDIDGTLVDSNYLHVSAWMEAFSELGHPVDCSRIHRCIGLGTPFLLTTLLGDALADQIGDAAKEAHSSHYAKTFEQLRAFEGAQDLVRTVAARGKAVLATSSAEPELGALRRVLDLDDVVVAITSADDVEAAKPEPDIVHTALERAGSGPDAAVFVGDTVWDVAAAGKAGVSCVGLLSGGISAAELLNAGARAVYDDAAALLANLDSSPLAAVLRPAGPGQQP